MSWRRRSTAISAWSGGSPAASRSVSSWREIAGPAGGRRKSIRAGSGPGLKKAGGVLKPAGLAGADVSAFLLRECGRVSAGAAGGRVAERRAVLRFLYLLGFTPLRLGTAVPPVGGWRLAALPSTMTTADVQLLLDSCDRSTGVGAIITLVARLGLRSIEVARLELRDVDWRAGELVVRGRARRQDRLPLPAQPGEALAAYLARGRIPAGARRLFLTCRAPRGPIRADLVGDVVERACLRAGLPCAGPHPPR